MGEIRVRTAQNLLGCWRQPEATAHAYPEGRDAAGGWMRERLAHDKCPKSVDLVHTLPRNPSGKLLKRLLREPCWAGHHRQV